MKYYRYTGAVLRAIRAVRGVGRPLKAPLPPDEEQRRSFVYGNVALSNPSITREMVDGIAARAQLANSVVRYGSQRKAAAALGISLGKLQRGLKKCV